MNESLRRNLRFLNFKRASRWTLRLAILCGAIALVGFALFASPDRTAGKSPTLVTAASGAGPDGNPSTVVPAAGCTGASFNQPVGSPLTSSVKPRAMLSADFNLDGRPDLAVFGESSNDLTIFLGNGAGGFTKTAASPIALGFSTVNVALGDFNLDGKPDILASNGASFTVGVLIGDGNGGFSQTNLTVPSGNFVGGIAVSDFNLDGKPDFAVANFTGSNASIMLGNGSGGFSAAPGSPVAAGTNPSGAVAGDFNQDGKPDLAISNISSNDVTILLGNGNGGFAPAAGSPVATNGAFPSRIFAADLNGDGKLDLVTSNFTGNSVSILLGNGNGTFAHAGGSPMSVAGNVGGVSIIDFNLDGKLDLIVSNTSGNTVQLFLGNGSGGFAAASGSPITVGNTSYWPVAADFNLDGRPDFAVTNYNSNTVSIELNSCNATPCSGVGFSAATGSPFSAQNRALTIADFNLDGKPDVAAVSFDANNLSVLLGNGSGGMTAAPGSPINLGASSLSLTSGDFNRDGKPDLAVARSGSNGISILLGNGAGGFGAPQFVAGSVVLPQWLATADFNRDGKPDLIAEVNTGVYVLLGDGAGGFTVAAGSPVATGSGSVNLVVSDFNGDAKPDVAVVSSGSNNVTILLGDGNGGLAPAAGSPVAAGTAHWSIVAADFNRDGKTDLAVPNVAGSSVSVLLGNGSGGFAQAAGSPFATVVNPFSISTGDLNIDGALDIVVSSSTVNNVTVLAGDGAGGFAQPAGSPLIGANANAAVATTDFNLDGRADLALINNDVSGLTILLNSCSAPVPTPTPTPTPTPNLVVFSPANFGVTEACTSVTINVTRSGDTSGSASVDYATSDGTATERGDYITARGTLNFAAGDTSKTFTVLINDDSIVEGTETFNINLSNPVGFNMGTPSTAVVSIFDNQSEPATNVIDDAQNFVCQHYHDFLNRQPDQAGWDFWTNQITACGTDAVCRDGKRVHVSAAFFLSIEFQNTGFFVERMYKAAYGDAAGTSTNGGSHQLPVPAIQYNEFVTDTQRIARGVVVLQNGWQQVLETNTQSYCAAFVAQSRFTTAYPTSMTPAQFVDKLNTNAGNPLSQAERDQLVADLTANVKTRAQVVRAVAEDPDLVNAEFSRAFVLAEYFGYLRRNPNSSPDNDYSGYDFWLSKMNQFNGNYLSAQMTSAYLLSDEYRHRFGP